MHHHPTSDSEAGTGLTQRRSNFYRTVKVGLATSLVFGTPLGMYRLEQWLQAAAKHGNCVFDGDKT